MTRDRSLDEFFGGDGGADDSETESAGDGDENGDGVVDADAGEIESAEDTENAGDDAGGADDAADAVDTLPDAADVDPATPTYRWTPEGAACESCGRVVERRWAADESDDSDDSDDGDAVAFVCDDCKEW